MSSLMRRTRDAVVVAASSPLENTSPARTADTLSTGVSGEGGGFSGAAARRGAAGSLGMDEDMTGPLLKGRAPDCTEPAKSPESRIAQGVGDACSLLVSRAGQTTDVENGSRPWTWAIGPSTSQTAERPHE